MRKVVQQGNYMVGFPPGDQKSLLATHTATSPQ